MASEIRVPTLGESVTEATIAQWYKKPGEAVSMDEPLCELETDKVTIEVPAQSAGVLEEVLFEEGATVEVGALLGSIDAEGTPAAPAETPAAEAPTPEPAAPAEAVAPAAPPAAETQSDALAPSVRRLVSEHGLSPADIRGDRQRWSVDQGRCAGCCIGTGLRSSLPNIYCPNCTPGQHQPKRARGAG